MSKSFLRIKAVKPFFLRRRDVPERLEPRWCDGASAEEHDLDRFVFNVEGKFRIRQGKSQGEIIDDAFYVEHNNSPTSCDFTSVGVFTEETIGTALAGRFNAVSIVDKN